MDLKRFLNELWKNISSLIKNTKKHLDANRSSCYFGGDMKTEDTKRSKGRPAGSNSFVRIRACDLIRMVGENAVIPVSKVWLRDNGIELIVPQIKTLSAIPAAEEQEEKIQFSLTTFED